jgi:hypothetical protein
MKLFTNERQKIDLHSTSMLRTASDIDFFLSYLGKCCISFPAVHSYNPMPAFVIFVNVNFGEITSIEMFHVHVGGGSPSDLHITVKLLPSLTISLLCCNSPSLANSFCAIN